MSEEIYLDNHVATQPSNHVIAQMQPFFKRHWKSTFAPYLKGKEPFISINRQTQKIAEFLGACEKDRFVLTSSGAEAVAHVFQSVYIDYIYSSGKNHIISMKTEDAPILMSAKRLEKLDCVHQTASSFEELEQLIAPRVGFVSLSYANGLTGVIQPIEQIAKLCKERGVLLHVDVTNILGKLYFNASELDVDFITFDGGALYAPKGTGGLLIRGDFGPLIPTASGDRGGEYNTASLIGLGVAIDELQENMDHMGVEVVRLRNMLEEGLLNAHIFFKDQDRLPNVTALAFKGVSAELLTYALSEQNIFVSFGGGHSQKLEYLVPEYAQCAISISLSRETSEEEIIRAVGVINDIVGKYQKLSVDL